MSDILQITSLTHLGLVSYIASGITALIPLLTHCPLGDVAIISTCNFLNHDMD